MPRYFFDLKDGRRLVDPCGVICADDNDAKSRAKILATEISQKERGRDTVEHVLVLDSSGDEIARVPIEH